MKKGMIALVVLVVLALSGCSLIASRTMTDEQKADYLLKFGAQHALTTASVEPFRKLLDLDEGAFNDAIAKAGAGISAGSFTTILATVEGIKVEGSSPKTMKFEFVRILKELKAASKKIADEKNFGGVALAKAAIVDWDIYLENFKSITK